MTTSRFPTARFIGVPALAFASLSLSLVLLPVTPEHAGSLEQAIEDAPTAEEILD